MASDVAAAYLEPNLVVSCSKERWWRDTWTSRAANSPVTR